MHQKYTHDEMHHELLGSIQVIPLSVRIDPQDTSRQALFCPYYVRLAGVLGHDWGVIVNPDSINFGRLVFEHFECGCPEESHSQGKQVTDEWRDRKRERDEVKKGSST